jgi:NADH-quinone oxidoreductase subunit M
MAFPLLSALIFVPLLGSVLIYLLGRNPKVARWGAIVVSFIPLILSLFLVMDLLGIDAGIALVSDATGNFIAFENAEWIPQFGITYALGVDGLSIPLIFLTTLLTTLAMVFSWDEKHRVREFYALLLLLETAIIGVFVALDFFLFFIFWELGLVPMYFLIAVWGGPRKKYAAIKFFLYTQAASLLVLLGILVMYSYLGTFSMIAAIESGGALIPIALQSAMFILLLIGFGTKLPMVPVHTWLPDAHVEAPTAGSVLLAGILLKMGGYGIIRVNLQMLPQATQEFLPLLAILGTISILYGAVVCLAQNDLKRMVAFSSISHMGFVLLGIASFNEIGITGAVFQMFAHGLVSPALFMIAGSVGHRTGTRNISDLGGITDKMPLTSGFMMIAFMASLGFPGLVGFPAEVTVFIGTYQTFGLWVLIPIITVVATAAYYIYAMQRAIFGPYNEKLGKVKDMEPFEVVPLGILSFLFALFGILPFLFMDAITSWAGLALLGGIG